MEYPDGPGMAQTTQDLNLLAGLIAGKGRIAADYLEGILREVSATLVEQHATELSAPQLAQTAVLFPQLIEVDPFKFLHRSGNFPSFSI